MCKITTEYYNEVTRNDSYVIMEKDKKSGILISYSKYLCKDINEKY